MRKTNNTKDLNREGVNSIWVVYDAGTDETLTFYNGDEPDRSEWKSVIIEEDVGGQLHEVEYSARFSAAEDAEEAARTMAQYIAQMHPEDSIDLEVRHVISEMTEMVTDVRTILTVTESWVPSRDASEGAERTLDLDSDDSDEYEEDEPYSVEQEEEEEEEEEEAPPTRLYRKGKPEAAFYTPLEAIEVTPPKAKKEKKSTKRKR